MSQRSLSGVYTLVTTPAPLLTAFAFEAVMRTLTPVFNHARFQEPPSDKDKTDGFSRNSRSPVSFNDTS